MSQSIELNKINVLPQSNESAVVAEAVAAVEAEAGLEGDNEFPLSVSLAVQSEVALDQGNPEVVDDSNVVAHEDHLAPKLKALADKVADVNKVDHCGKNEVIRAVKADDMTVLQKAIHNGADLNKVDHSGKTAIMYAVEDKNANMLDVLVRNGADLNKINSLGRTAVMHLVETDNMEGLQMLLPYRPDLDIIDRGDVQNAVYSNMTAISYAIIGNNLPMLKELVSNGANLNKAGTNLNKASYAVHYLDLAIARENIAVIKMLLSCGAKLRSPSDHFAHKALLCAVKNQDPEAIRMLVGAGASWEALDECGNTLLISVIDDIDQLNNLMKFGVVDVNACNKFGNTALKKAMYKNNLEAMKILINADVALGDDASKFLEYALSHKNMYEPVKLLIKAGVKEFDEKFVSFFCKALDYAIKQGDRELEALLKDLAFIGGVKITEDTIAKEFEFLGDCELFDVYGAKSSEILGSTYNNFVASSITD